MRSVNSLCINFIFLKIQYIEKVHCKRKCSTERLIENYIFSHGSCIINIPESPTLNRFSSMNIWALDMKEFNVV